MMIKLGMLGGMSWESTAVYYRKLNEGIRKWLGGLHSCPVIMHSVDFAPFADNMDKNDWTSLSNRTKYSDIDKKGSHSDSPLDFKA